MSREFSYRGTAIQAAGSRIYSLHPRVLRFAWLFLWRLIGYRHSVATPYQLLRLHINKKFKHGMPFSL